MLAPLTLRTLFISRVLFHRLILPKYQSSVFDILLKHEDHTLKSLAVFCPNFDRETETNDNEVL